MLEEPEGTPVQVAASSAVPGAGDNSSGGSSSGGGQSNSGGGQGSSATGDTVPNDSGSGVHVDPDGLIHPIAIVSKAASTYSTAYASLVGMILSGALDLGDSDVNSAWSAFLMAWLGEVDTAEKALKELASHVPKAVHAMQAADTSGGGSVSGATGLIGVPPASLPPVSSAPSSTGGKGGSSSGSATNGRVRPQ
ncbi:hypothetical protein ACFYXQ_41910 [Nocardia jiangxiensis]|uniref:Excreted virulence factor EspC, type VII ESX diderm n=1 Tax=Nocardia jiangxiensis TaxID=282685 RepID=A0ABW6SGE9_9NOCA